MKKLIFVALTIVQLVFVGLAFAQREVNMKDAFLKAVTGGDQATVRSMINRDPKLVASKNDKGQSAVILATFYGKKEIVEILLKSGVELNIFDAAATGQTTRVRSLITQDKSLINAYAPDGFFPLGLAIFFGHLETASVLLEAGADVNMASRESMKVTPLHSAVAARQLEIGKKLLSLGAMVDARGETGFTPLMEAAANGDMEFAKLLLDSGADVNARDSVGKTPLDFAVSKKQNGMATFLRERGSQP